MGKGTGSMLKLCLAWAALHGGVWQQQGAGPCMGQEVQVAAGGPHLWQEQLVGGYVALVWPTWVAPPVNIMTGYYIFTNIWIE